MEGGRTFLLKKRNEECKEKEWAETRMEDTTRGTDIRRCGETIWDTVGDEILGRVRGETAGYGNRKRVKKGGYGKCSLETLSTLHADGHRFGKTKWRAVAKGRKEEGRKKKGKSGWWARGSRFTQNRFPLCLTAPAPSLPHATASVPFLLLSLLSLFLSFSLSLLLSPNFVANLRATKSAPFDFTLIRCRCRAIDEANLSLYAEQGPKGISFSAVRAIPSPAGLFQGNHFPLRPPTRYSAPSIVPVFLCALLSFRSSRLYIPPPPPRCLSSPLSSLSRSCLS